MAGYQVLARKYRPLRFSDVVGQDHVTRTLLNALAQNRIAHGYIFSGHRGIGKTTIARILASALNCRNAIGSALRPTPEPCLVCESCLEIRQGNAVDVIEIDAATNRGIDEIRELRDAARYSPARDKYKIIILDEAHQITDAAFNALLKTLEEPPEHIVFMMATTEPENIPQTIRSRCQHFSFHAVKLDDIVGQLRSIATAERISASDATLGLLAEAGDGSMRDALSIMDQAIASAPVVDDQPVVEIDQVRELMGSVSNVVYEQVLEAVHANSSADVIAIVARLLDAGNGASQIARQFVRFLRNCVVAKITGLSPDTAATGAAADLLQISAEERSRCARSAALFTEEDLSRFLSIMLRTFDDLGYRQEQRFHLELGLLKLVHVQRLIPVEDLLAQLGGGATALKTNPSAPASTPRPAAGAPRPAAAARPAASTSPFEADRTRKVPLASAAASASSISSTAGSLALADQPQPEPPPTRPHLVPASATVAAAEATPQPIATKTIAAEAIAAPPINAPVDACAVDLDGLQHALGAALRAARGHDSASHEIEQAGFVLDGQTIAIQTSVSAAMLTLLFNADADRVMKTVLRERGLAALKIKFLPGTSAPGAPANVQKNPKPRAATAGSAEELAARHPIVQRAQQLFSADIIKVDDLREND